MTALIDREKSAIKFVDDYLDHHVSAFKSELGVPLKSVIEHVQSSAPPEIRKYVERAHVEVECFLKTRSHLWKLVQHDDLFVQKVDPDSRRLLVTILKFIEGKAKINRGGGVYLNEITVHVNYPLDQDIENFLTFLGSCPYLFTVVDDDGRGCTRVTTSRAEIINDVIVFPKMRGYGRFFHLNKSGNYGLVRVDHSNEVACVRVTRKFKKFDKKRLVQLNSENRKFEFEAVFNHDFQNIKIPHYWRISRLISIDDVPVQPNVEDAKSKKKRSNGEKLTGTGRIVSANDKFCIIKIDDSRGRGKFVAGKGNVSAAQYGIWQKNRQRLGVEAKARLKDPKKTYNYKWNITKIWPIVEQDPPSRELKSLEQRLSELENAMGIKKRKIDTESSDHLEGTGQIYKLSKNFGFIKIDKSVDSGLFRIAVSGKNKNELEEAILEGQRFGFKACLAKGYLSAREKVCKWNITEMWPIGEQKPGMIYTVPPKATESVTAATRRTESEAYLIAPKVEIPDPIFDQIEQTDHTGDAVEPKKRKIPIISNRDLKPEKANAGSGKDHLRLALRSYLNQGTSSTHSDANSGPDPVRQRACINDVIGASKSESRSSSSLSNFPGRQWATGERTVEMRDVSCQTDFNDETEVIMRLIRRRPDLLQVIESVINEQQ